MPNTYHVKSFVKRVEAWAFARTLWAQGKEAYITAYLVVHHVSWED